MRTGFIAFGIILLVLGVVLYFIPTQTAGARTSTQNSDGTYTQISTASVTVPESVTYMILGIGAILFVLGLALPGSDRVIVRNTQNPGTNRTYDVESNEEVNLDGKHKKTVIREHYVRRV